MLWADSYVHFQIWTEIAGSKHWAINSYTTTGHNLPQSHLPTKQDAYVTTWVVPAAKTRAQSAPATCSLLHTKHTSLSHQIDCYSAVQGHTENKKTTMTGAECEARRFFGCVLNLTAFPWPTLVPGYSRAENTYETTQGTNTIYVHEREVLEQRLHGSGTGTSKRDHPFTRSTLQCDKTDAKREILSDFTAMISRLQQYSKLGIWSSKERLVCGEMGLYVFILLSTCSRFTKQLFVFVVSGVWYVTLLRTSRSITTNRLCTWQRFHNLTMLQTNWVRQHPSGRRFLNLLPFKAELLEPPVCGAVMCP